MYVRLFTSIFLPMKREWGNVTVAKGGNTPTLYWKINEGDDDNEKKLMDIIKIGKLPIFQTRRF